MSNNHENDFRYIVEYNGVDDKWMVKDTVTGNIVSSFYTDTQATLMCLKLNRDGK